MSILNVDTKALVNYYDRACLRFSSSYKAVGWYSLHTQRRRFDVLSDMANWHQKSILDVGCGQADLLGYLHDHGIVPDYTGIDLSANMLQKSREKFPQNSFYQQDLFSLPTEKQYDYCVASGPFNHKLRVSQTRYIHSAITQMMGLSRLGVAFNLLSDKTPAAEKDDTQFFYYSAEKIRRFCLTFSAHVEVKEGYLPNDFTVYVYKMERC